MNSSTMRKYLPWLLLVVIPLWIGAVVMEILDAKLLEREGVPVIGRIESPKWIAGKKGGHRLMFEAVWSHEGKEFRKEFRIPREKGNLFEDADGKLFESRLEMHYAPSKPEVASLDIQPPDPVWVSMIIACIGLCVLCGVVFYLIRYWRGPSS